MTSQRHAPHFKSKQFSIADYHQENFNNKWNRRILLVLIPFMAGFFLAHVIGFFAIVL